MSSEEPVIKLSPLGDSSPATAPIRLEKITKKHHHHAARYPTKTPVALRVIEEEPKEPIKPAHSEKKELKRHAYEGKSVDYNIDEILQPSPYDANALESEWDSQKRSIPPGMIAVICLGVCLAAAALLMLIRRNHDVEDRIADMQHATQQASETELRAAQELVAHIEDTVRQYFRAKTIDEKLRFVRHSKNIRPLMEEYYSRHPMISHECDLITGLESFTLDEKSFWKVSVIDVNQQRKHVTLEQISDTELLVDWESLVNYQPISWSDYARTKPFLPMDFRVTVQSSPRYIGEFSDESRWASYRLTTSFDDEILFGYVTRHSEAHDAIEAAIQSQEPIIILTLQASKALTVKDSVVIQKLVSPHSIRMEAPRISSP